ncbi:MAG: hypothetical protein ACOX87_08700, partial [Chloroflexota bacterium]
LCALGAIFESLGEIDRAILCYERASDIATLPELRGRAMLRLGTLFKRLRMRDDAVEMWRKLAGSGYGYTMLAYVEMAKHFEHVARDYREAERLTLRALMALELKAARDDPWRVEQQRIDLEHRLTRLRRKIIRYG